MYQLKPQDDIASIFKIYLGEQKLSGFGALIISALLGVL
jgi:hypothetical protein